MYQAPAPQLAVAMLQESDSAVGFRHHPGRPLQGYCLLTGDGEQCRFMLYLENGRTLSDRSVHSPFYYEGWVVSDTQAISLGVFNTGPHGEGTGTALIHGSQANLHQALAVRVTAEPFGGSPGGWRPVLEGRLIWLSGAPQQPLPSSLWPLSGAEPSPYHTLPWAGVLSAMPWLSSQPGQMEGSPETAPPPPADPAAPLPLAALWSDAEPKPGAEPEPGTESEPRAALGPAPAAPEQDQPADPARPEPELASDQEPEPPVAAPAPAPAQTDEQEQLQTPPADEIRAEARVAAVQAEPHEPALRPAEQEPPGLHHRAETRLTFHSLHPLAPRAGGSGMLDRVTGTITLSLWGLPSPASLGRERSTDRPFNTYRVWLYNQRSGQRASLGFCTRQWGDNYRFEGEVTQPLSGFDSLLITTHERTSPIANPSAPQVLLGRPSP